MPKPLPRATIAAYLYKLSEEAAAFRSKVRWGLRLIDPESTIDDLAPVDVIDEIEHVERLLFAWGEAVERGTVLVEEVGQDPRPLLDRPARPTVEPAPGKERAPARELAVAISEPAALDEDPVMEPADFPPGTKLFQCSRCYRLRLYGEHPCAACPNQEFMLVRIDDAGQVVPDPDAADPGPEKPAKAKRSRKSKNGPKADDGGREWIVEDGWLPQGEKQIGTVRAPSKSEALERAFAAFPGRNALSVDPKPVGTRRPRSPKNEPKADPAWDVFHRRPDGIEVWVCRVWAGKMGDAYQEAINAFDQAKFQDKFDPRPAAKEYDTAIRNVGGERIIRTDWGTVRMATAEPIHRTTPPELDPVPVAEPDPDPVAPEDDQAVRAGMAWWEYTPAMIPRLTDIGVDALVDAGVLNAGHAWHLLERGELVDRPGMTVAKAKGIEAAIVWLRDEKGDPVPGIAAIAEPPAPPLLQPPDWTVPADVPAPVRPRAFDVKLVHDPEYGVSTFAYRIEGARSAEEAKQIARSLHGPTGGTWHAHVAMPGNDEAVDAAGGLVPMALGDGGEQFGVACLIPVAASSEEDSAT